MSIESIAPTAHGDRAEELLDKDPMDLSSEEKVEIGGPSPISPAVTTAMADGAAPDQAVTEQGTCGICGQPVKAGDQVTSEMIYPEDGVTAASRRIVHVECQKERAQQNRVGDVAQDEEAQPQGMEDLSDSDRKAKEQEVARKETTQDLAENSAKFRDNQTVARP